MSAYIVSDRHISAMVAAGLHLPRRLEWLVRVPDTPATVESGPGRLRGCPWGPGAVADAKARERYLDRGNAGQVGQMLIAANQDSVNFRYDENDPEPVVTIDEDADRGLPYAALLGVIDTYEYQSCEHPGWEFSEAASFTEALRRALIRELPEYQFGELM